MATSIGQIQLDLGVNSSGFKQQLRGATKVAKSSTNALSSMFGKLGGVIAGAFAVKAIVNFSKECLTLGSDLAEVQNVVDVTFGSMSGKVNEWARNAMEAYGLSEKVAKEYMGQFGAMSKAFGNTEAMAYDQAAALTGLAGDVASFYNMTTEEAFTKLKSVYTGETESLKSLGVVMTQTALDEYAMQKGMAKTTAQMSEQEKVALRLAFVTDRLSTASGDFARTSDGWANQTRVLALRFDALKASIGQGLINVLLPIVRVLNDIVARLQVAADAFRDFTEAIFGKKKTAMAGAGAAITEGMGVASSASDNIASNSASAAKSANAIKKSLAGFDVLNVLPSGSSGDAGGGSTGLGGSTLPDVTEPMAPAVNSNAEKIKGFLDDVKTKLKEIADMTGLSGLWDDFLISVGNVKQGVLNLFDSFKGAVADSQPAFDKFKTSISNTFLTVSQTVSGILGDMFISLSEGFASFTEEYSADIQATFASVISIITEHATLISDVAGDIWGSINEWWSNDGKRIFDEVIGVVKDVGGWILEIWNAWIVPVIEHAQKVLRKLWDNHLKPLWDNVLGALTDVWDAIKAVWDFLKPVVDWIIDECAPYIIIAVNTLSNVVGAAIQTIVNAVDGMVTALRGVATFISGVFSGDWKKAWEGIQLTFKGIWNAISGTFQGVGKIFSSVFEGMKKGAKEAWSGVKSAFAPISSWFGEKLTTVKEKFSGAWSKLKSGASDAWKGIKSTFSNVPKWFKEKFTDAWEGVKKVFSSGGKIFSGIKEGIETAFKTIVNKLIDGINTVVAKPFNKINDLLDDIRGVSILGAKPFSWLGSISVPQIPKLATGGYVAANSPQLAIIGDNKREGEIVAPESKIAEAVAAGVATAMQHIAGLLTARNNSNQTTPVVIKIGETDFWQGFVDFHNSTVKRTGESPLLI